MGLGEGGKSQKKTEREGEEPSRKQAGAGVGLAQKGGVSRKIMQSSLGGVTGIRHNDNRKSPLQTLALIHIDKPHSDVFPELLLL